MSYTLIPKWVVSAMVKPLTGNSFVISRTIQAPREDQAIQEFKAQCQTNNYSIIGQIIIRPSSQN